VVVQKATRCQIEKYMKERRKKQGAVFDELFGELV
jgi:hypothetical protein